ncbi:nitrilase family protein (plasmid) [Embleya sp. NBC_00888]|uniref:nitrilase family protein n=1 Tax=Embleya sp. NBC_00888 TaxID=2975960 RepID=UPI002F916298|nr:nitrilase family protein [Embleya sp. NBC_00888]
MPEPHAESASPPAGDRRVSPARIAVVQCDARVGVDQREENVERGLALAGRAADDGATLIVLPELCATGYAFATRAEAYAHAEEVPAGETVRRWEAFARDRAVHLVGGLAERDGVRLYSSAVLVGPDGYIGHYRKTHLWNTEKLWFTPGDRGLPVFETTLGRVGLLICWDIWFPETSRLLALQGADVICSVNNWVWTPPPVFDPSGRCMAVYLTMTAAHVNNVVIAAANRIGTDRDARFLGCSLIAGTNGWPIGEIAGPDEERILTADVDVVDSRSAPIWNGLNDLVRDRRTDLYQEMLGYAEGRAFPR